MQILLLLKFELAHFMLGLLFLGLFHEVILHLLELFELSLIFDQDFILVFQFGVLLLEIFVLFAQLVNVDLLQFVDLKLYLGAA